ncbi:B3/B4 domain-containing protein [Desmospora profundinema]|uniref:DNA/RNA-binding domain of Phe-tRNA-synthetase-like protein n=1 Tax=Desmospora profundinema TaxID=1571184 RepID=A0ABU1IQJ3_9BACL|nr:phenylalanine--tRNA ligase beta subunit-related protein [Desmospora profundinema]MDR6226807.1 DNA/RNA-binding domain of Phe-tRNA-synthetase-like protein [Desmospora profundinema]
MSNPMLSTIAVQVDPAVLQRHPRLRITGMAVDGVSPRFEDYPQLKDYLEQVREEFDPDHPLYRQEIQRWRAAYGQMGIKPSKHHCSLESLYRRMSKGHLPFGIHPLVDLYNAISIRYGLCMGGYDLDRIRSPITLLSVTEEAQMTPIGSSDPIHLQPGSIAYASASEIICAYWNHRDADATKISESTRRAIFFIDEVEPEEGRAPQALSDLKKLLAIPMNSLSKTFVTDSQNPSLELPLK